MGWFHGVMEEQRQRSTCPTEQRRSEEHAGLWTAQIVGLRLSPHAQLFLNSPCLVKQDDRGEEKKRGRAGVNRKLPHHCRRAGDTLKVST